MKITLGIPTNRHVQSLTVKCLLELVAYSRSHDFQIVCATEGYTIAENRSYIVAKARGNKSEYLLFVDDDMIFPKETLNSLLFHKRGIVGVLSNSRKLPLKPTVEFLNSSIEERSKKLFEVKAVGGGVLLIDMKVFENIKQPWFSFEVYEFGMTKMGEDSWFCQRARDAGYRIWCDPTIKIGHIGNYIY